MTRPAGARGETRELLHEIMLLTGPAVLPLGEARALIAQWIMDAGYEWAESRKGLPRTMWPGRVHLTVTYYPDETE